MPNESSFMPHPRSTRNLSNNFLGSRVVRILEKQKSLSEVETEVLEKALHRINLALEGGRFLSGIKGVFRSQESITEYTNTRDIIKSKFETKTQKELFNKLGLIHEELVHIIKSGKTNPKKTPTAILFFKELEEYVESPDSKDPYTYY